MGNKNRVYVNFSRDEFEAIEELARKAKKSNSQFMSDIVKENLIERDKNDQTNLKMSLTALEVMLSQVLHLVRLLTQESSANMYRIGFVIGGFPQPLRDNSRAEMADFIASRMKDVERELEAIAEVAKLVR